MTGGGRGGRAPRPKTATATGLTAAGLTALLALTGCSRTDAEQPVPTPTAVDLSTVDPDDPDGNALWHLRDAELLGRVVDAVGDEPSVRMRGTITEKTLGDGGAAVPGRSIGVDVVRSADDYLARIDADEVEVEVTVVGGDAYVSGNAALAEQTGVAEVADGAVCVTPDDEIVRRWSPVADPELLLESLLLETETPASGREPSAEDSTVEVVVGEEAAPLGRILVARVGAPLPSELVVADETGSAELRFDGWGDEQGVEPPARVSRPCG
ncbi:hypothetical protein [Mycetocola reblochoni]|uniref:Lipoprotein n=2 Tax=Mycetocola reblochoni TaxID=331618 RepID=A0A1R4K2U5_9MICO|nr:hypothetical protein [Mycetocola reblochoni]RLP67692.1 hypothetical protein D9V30_13170 [Mycetocola reblochoni]SJN38556.1 hypothetical protein FM119_11000 [Mycetocola reblochoni REB411]